MTVALGIAFRIFLLVFHGYLLVRMVRLLRELPELKRLELSDPYLRGRSRDLPITELSKFYGATRTIACAALLLQTWALFAAMAAPFSSLLGFFAQAAPAILVITSLWPRELKWKRARAFEEAFEEGRKILLGHLDQEEEVDHIDLIASWPQMTRSLDLELGDRARILMDVSESLREEGLIEEYNKDDKPWNRHWRLTESGRGLLDVQGLREKGSG